MVGLAVMGTLFAGAVTQHQYAAVNQALATQALYLAEGGFELAIQELLDNLDMAFNGAAADGVIGGLTNVSLGAGTVTVLKTAGTPPTLTATGTVRGIKRTVSMTLDVKNLVNLDPVFENLANLPVNWPETPPAVGSDEGSSTIEANALKAATVLGKNKDFNTYREQALAQVVPVNTRVGVRVSHMRDHTGSSSWVNRQTLELRLVKSDGSSDAVWSVGPGSVSTADKGLWLQADVRGFQTSPTLTTTKVRLVYDLGTSGSADAATGQASGWLDNVAVNVVNKGAWKEP